MGDDSLDVARKLRRNALARARYRVNLAQRRARGRADYWANLPRRRAAVTAYRRANPEVFAQHSAARRARKFVNGGSHTLAEWTEKCALLGNVCIYCGQDKPLERDHKAPLTRGGSDDIANIVPSCRTCNIKKFVKTATEFIAVAA